MRNAGRIGLAVALAGLGAVVAPAGSRAANTYFVNSSALTHDAAPGNGVCATAGGVCTLLAAVEEANTDGVPSTIRFSQDFHFSYYPLPAFNEGSTTVDASDRFTPGGVPGVSIGAAGYHGLITLSSHSNALYGLKFDGGSTGVLVTSGSGNVIGGTGTGQRNVFLSQYGVEIQGGTQTRVVGNYFGTTNGWQHLPGTCTRGIYATATATIRGNVIGGCSAQAIDLRSSGNVVDGNHLGVGYTNSDPMPNGTGMQIATGGGNTVTANWICANSGDGIFLFHSAGANSIRGNQIGGYLATLGNGGHGIHVQHSDRDRIGGAAAAEGNVVAYNKGDGIRVAIGAASEVIGNSIHDNDGDGVHTATDTRILGPPGAQNVIEKNGGHGVHLAGPGAVVAGNLIGLAGGSFDGGNLGAGVFLDGGAAQCSIGGRLAGMGNRIGFNRQGGIRLSGSGVTGNVLEANLLGLPLSLKWAAGNGQDGIRLDSGASGNFIGSAGYGNVVLASGWSGISLVGSGNNWVVGNLVGTDGRGHNWGNLFYGILIVNAAGNVLTLNQVAHNGTEPSGTAAGVRIDGAAATGNVLLFNSIHRNDGPGIELAGGANGGIAPPVLTDATCWAGVRGTTCPNCYVEIFSDEEDEGRLYEGSLIADGGGSFHWTGPVTGLRVTATVLGPAGTGTSAFSSARRVGRCSRVSLPLVKR